MQMSKIEYLYFKDKMTIEMLSSAFSDNSLVPVIGAGFTRGCITNNSEIVPSGEDFRQEMIDIIIKDKNYSPEKVQRIRDRTFSAVSDLYFNPDFVDPGIVKRRLTTAFQGVQLDDLKSSFINDINWPYIYTLNVDDAIEKNSKYITVLPYEKSLSSKAKDYPTLFKLHGDINYELRHDESRLIFQKRDYLKSLNENKTMLELLKLDMINKNIIYIGCSLYDELDISALVAQENLSLRRNTKNIVFLSSKLDDIEEQDYISVGINCVILIEPSKYDQIYQTIIEAYQLSANKTKSLDIFKGGIKELDETPEKNQDFLIKGIIELNNERKISNKVIPYYYAQRDVEEAISKSIRSNEITILQGKRVSGKTLLSFHILNKIKDKSIYIVESNQRIDSNALLQLIGQKNSIILFDHGSLSKESFTLIKQNRKILSTNNTSILICAIDNDNDADYYLNQAGSRTGVFTLSAIISRKELLDINKKAINAKLPTFTDGKFLLDKIYNVFSIIGENKLISSIKKSEELFSLLYVLAIKHSFTGEEIHFSGLDQKAMLSLSEQHTPYLQTEKINHVEQNDHTNYKIVTYANSWVVSVLRYIFREKGTDWCSEVLMKLFISSYKSSKSFVTELRKFDSLNFVFTSEQNGAGTLILNLYDKLKALEGKEPEFYVQKSKAYFNMYQASDLTQKMDECIQELNIAYTWAKTNHSLKTQQNISHIKASLCLRKVTSLKTPDIETIILTINAIHQTIGEEGNYSYNSELFRGKSKSGRLLGKFMHIIEQNSDVKLLLEKGKVHEIKLKQAGSKY
jgi:hypothetical protein